MWRSFTPMLSPRCIGVANIHGTKWGLRVPERLLYVSFEPIRWEIYDWKKDGVIDRRVVEEIRVSCQGFTQRAHQLYACTMHNAGMTSHLPVWTNDVIHVMTPTSILWQLNRNKLNVTPRLQDHFPNVLWRFNVRCIRNPKLLPSFKVGQYEIFFWQESYCVEIHKTIVLTWGYLAIQFNSSGRNESGLSQ